MTQGPETASPDPGQIAVLILGMHRSGTSLLSSLVQSLGISIGEHLLPADMHNPAGYFEDQECVDIQERMLLALGQPWHGENGMLPFPAEWWRDPALLPLVGELETWVDNRRSSLDPVWAVKDPRTTRFLPLWQELLKTRGITPRYLLAVRDPAEVVASQVTRESVPAERIYRTWLRYNMEALLHGGADIAGVFVYSQWFSDGAAQLRRLAAILGVNINDDECDAILARSLNSELRRQYACAASSPNWASHLYTHLESLSDQQNLKNIPELASEAEYFDAALRQGQEPDTKGALTAVLTSATGLPEAVRLAHRLRADGARVVLSVDEEAPAADTGDLAVVIREINGPPIEGRPQACAAYALWRWLQPRAFAAAHIEGGHGLAAYTLDSRRQGLPDQHGSIHVHYFTPPPWLNECGYIHFHNMREAEAWCLERRVIASNGRFLHAHPTLRAMLHNVAVDEPDCSASPIPADQVAPLVSICITHFNRPALLADCLDSVRHQTYADIEVILVDDGSTQPAARVFVDSLEEEFQAKGWTLIRQENRYLGAARNAAARAAKGDYLFILDDDNLLLPDGIEKAVRIARHTNADIVTSVMAMFHGPAGTYPTWPDRLRVFLGGAPLFGLFDNTLGDANALVRRSCWSELGGYTEDRGTGTQDWELYATATLRGYRLETSLDPLFWYRVSANGMALSGDWWADYRLALRAYEAILPPALRELPALAGVLWRQGNETEQRTRNLEAELASRDHYLVELRDQARHLEAELAARDHHLVELGDQARHLEAELAARDRHLAELGDHTRQIEAELAARDRHLAELGDHARQIAADLAARDRHLAELGDHARQITADLAARDHDLAKIRADLVHAGTREQELVEHVAQARAAITQTANCATEAEHRAAEAEHLARSFEAESGELRSQLNSVLESTSWQVTWPLRRALDGHPRTAQGVRRAAKLAWWTVTLQLPRRIASRRREVQPPTVAFVICTERHFENKSLLLVRSLRRYGGTLGAESPIFSYSPRPTKAPSECAQRELAALGVRLVLDVVNSRWPEYGFANKVVACADAERKLTAETIVFLDSDEIVLREPCALRLARDVDVAARPVDRRFIGIGDEQDENHEYWSKLYEIAGSLPQRKVRTTLDDEPIWEYYNSGLIAARRELGLFSHWEKVFGEILDSGVLPTAGLHYVEQSALAASITAKASRVDVLSGDYNVPCNEESRGALSSCPDLAVNATTLHYHSSFDDGRWREWLSAESGLRLPTEKLSWLNTNLAELGI